jgi:hypothetical protein
MSADKLEEVDIGNGESQGRHLSALTWSHVLERN